MRVSGLRRPARWQRAAALVAGGLVAAMTAAVAPSAVRHVIVRSAHGSDGAAAAVTGVGGSVERRLDLIGAVAARVPSASVDRLASVAGVTDVARNGRLQLQSVAETFDRKTDTGSLHNTAKTVDADVAWQAGVTGAGVDVAVIDSGVSPVGGFDSAGAVVNGPDLSFESGDPERRHRDSYGHGTHLAGIIAGRSRDATGVAPGARVVNVKVADGNGATDVSQVIAAIDWVVQRGRRDGLNVRVLNLAFGTDGGADYRSDPLAFAVEVAWRRGLVVVVSGGNRGEELGRLTNPAVDPYVIAVGAAETNGTRSVGDDRVAPFSSRGDGRRNPDVVAPGKSIVSLRVPGSRVDTSYPDARVGDELVRGSGSSQAAAVVAGASALLLEQRPELTPDQVKAALVAGARPVPGFDAVAQGSGLVNVRNASTQPPSDVEQTWEPATGHGSIHAARGSLSAVRGGDRIAGERDAWGRQWDANGWAASSWSGSSWSGSSWSGSSWSGWSWSGSSWSGSSWSGSSWSGSSWTATEWG